MITSNNSLKIPLSLADLSKILGSSSNDLGTLCTHPNINIWARYKPIKYASIIPVTEQIRKDCNWGITIPFRTGLGNMSSGFFKELYEGSLQWSYQKPTGGSNSPYRISDFVKTEDMTIGYKHDCVNFISGVQETSVILDTTKKFSLGFDLVVDSNNTYNLSIRDFKVNSVEFTNMYLGLLLVKGSTFKYITSLSALGSGNDLSISVEGASSLVGVWKMIPFLSSVKYTGVEHTAQSGTYCSINIKKIYNLTILDSGQQYGVIYNEITWNSNHTSISYNIQLENKSSGSVTFTDVKLYIVTTTGSTDPSAGYQVTSKTLTSSVSLARNSKSSEYKETISITGFSTSKIYWAGVQASNPTIAANWTQIEESGDMLD